MSYAIRQLSQSDLCCYRALRLQALTECPAAFGATPATERALDDAQLLSRFSGAQGQAMWGGFDADGRLCASLGLHRDQGEKTAHKGHLFAMYVAASARGRGLARALLETAMTHGRALNLRQLMLGCNAGNDKALRLYEQAGFRAYGLEPAALYVGGEYLDEVLMVLELGRPLTAGQAARSEQAA